MLDFKLLLEATRTIAVVGLSDDPMRPSYGIGRYLQQAGYRIIPVNPHHARVLGERCYDRIQDAPAEPSIDLVNIFRHPRYTADMIRDVLERIAATGERPVIWTQLGVSSAEAQQLAEGAGLAYVHNRCILVEHARLFG